MSAVAVLEAPAVAATELATIAQILADGACTPQCICAYGRSCRPNPRRETANSCDCPCMGEWHGRAAALLVPGSEDYVPPRPVLKPAPVDEEPTLFNLSWEQAHGFPGDDEDEADSA